MSWFLLFVLVAAGSVAAFGAGVAYLVRVLGGDGHVRTTAHPAQPQSGGTAGRVFWLLVGMGAVALAVTAVTPRARHVSAPPPPEPMARMSPRNLQAHAAANAVVAAAAAGQRELGQGAVPVRFDPRPYPPGGPMPAVHLSRVRSEAPAASRERALSDALTVARSRLAEKLAALDPPVTDVPTIEDVRRKYLRAESVTEVPPTPADKEAWAAANLDPNRVWVEIDVEVTDDQLRDLRAAERMTFAVRYAAAAFAAVLTAFAFLRLDAWTKGYLTPTLGVVAVLLAAAAVVGVVAF